MEANVLREALADARPVQGLLHLYHPKPLNVCLISIDQHLLQERVEGLVEKRSVR